MSNSLTADFSSFIDSRLNCFERELAEHTDYKRQNDNIGKCTQDLLSAMPSAMTITLGDMDDSYLEIISLSERVSYRQGFSDALRLMAEF